jgi:hypothetical protein
MDVCTFKIHYRNNLIDKKNSYLIARPPSWDDRNYSYGNQLYPSDYVVSSISTLIHVFVSSVDNKYTLENTEGAIRNEPSRETGNIWYTRRRKTKNTTQYVLDTI